MMVTGAELSETVTTSSVLSSCTKNVSLFSNMPSLMIITWSHWRDVLALKVRTAEVVMKSTSATDITK